MCFVLCFCCISCNNFSSKCIEITILILLIISIAAAIIGILFVKKEHASDIGYGCILVVICLSIILIISILLILFWRITSKINNKRNFAASVFSSIGLVVTIFCILFTAIYENMSINHFYNLNSPCKVDNTKVKNKNKTNLILLLRNLLTYEENKEEFCLENPDYNPHIVSRFEYIYVLCLSSGLEFIFLVLLYFWYNDFRRIKFLVDGKLIDSNTKENKIKYVDKKSKFTNNNFNQIIYGQNDYVVHYDIYGRPIFNIKKNKSKIINLNDNKKNLQLNMSRTRTIDESKNQNNINNEKGQNYNKDKKEISGSEIVNIYNFNMPNNRRRINISNLNLNMSKSSGKININNSYNSSGINNN